MSASDSFRRLRVEPGSEPELRCPHCNEWWPLTAEFWRLNEWSRCVACKREQDRLRAAVKRADPAYREAAAAYQRRYRSYVKRTAPGLLEAYDRERRAKRRVDQRIAREGQAA